MIPSPFPINEIVDINFHPDINHPLTAGARQTGKTLSAIPDNHKRRYWNALSIIQNGGHVADLGCGVGYGSAIISDCFPLCRIKGIDGNSTAIEQAKDSYNRLNIEYICADLSSSESNWFSFDPFDAIVAIEIIEHVYNDGDFINAAFHWTKKGGRLFLTTPNAAMVPVGSNAHIRHYHVSDIFFILESAGFVVDDLYFLDRACNFSDTPSTNMVFIAHRNP